MAEKIICVENKGRIFLELLLALTRVRMTSIVIMGR